MQKGIRMNSVFVEQRLCLADIDAFRNVGFIQLFVPTGTLILANEESDWFLSLIRHNGCNILFRKSGHHIPTDPHRRPPVDIHVLPFENRYRARNKKKKKKKKRELDGITYIRGRYTLERRRPHNGGGRKRRIIPDELIVQRIDYEINPLFSNFPIAFTHIRSIQRRTKQHPAE